MKKPILIAIGGNSLIRAGQKGTIADQFGNARALAEHLADIAAQGYPLVLTHGNGPQVGAQLLRSEIASSQTYTLPLDVCVSMTQGEIGYILQNSLQTVFHQRGLNISVATILTHVLVEKKDPAFHRPTKPIGPFYSKEVAEEKEKEMGWTMMEDASRGYRRVVPSPRPLRILELDIIRTCLESGIVIIAAGGGGIPLVKENGKLVGVEAVIDKDRVSALLATELKLPRLVISTDVEYVCLNYKKPNQEAIKSMTVEAAKRYLAEGHFLEGSMKPKIEASIEFLQAGGAEAIITNPEHILLALGGTAGTHILP